MYRYNHCASITIHNRVISKKIFDLVLYYVIGNKTSNFAHLSSNIQNRLLYHVIETESILFKLHITLLVIKHVQAYKVPMEVTLIK